MAITPHPIIQTFVADTFAQLAAACDDLRLVFWISTLMRPLPTATDPLAALRDLVAATRSHTPHGVMGCADDILARTPAGRAFAERAATCLAMAETRAAIHAGAPR